jgi:pimeloyl-ACP methyl ester carboxylesterase
MLCLAVFAVYARFHRDLATAAKRATHGGAVLDTRCGPIQVQQAGQGLPLLMIHGSGGGHDQGMDFARPLAAYGIRVVAVSRFGYLHTPRPPDASPEAQANAHVCVLDALGIAKAAIVGASAGGPSALQTAIRHPDRVSALVLVVPITYQPGSTAGSVPPISDEKDAWLMRLLGSDFLVWAVLHVARDRFFEHVLATPAALIHTTSAHERARAHAMAEHVLPVSLRVAGLMDDTRLGKGLKPYPLETIHVPTLAISARDDAFGTYAAAQYTASRVPGAKFIGYAQGGHLLVGHTEETYQAIAGWIHAAAVP